ncbi:MAG: GWxTD domain-containing protein [candidate division Zixibacteria bacterium]|nr:GWxTD domain-containing protein [candidate division Zixibacteria bacterium]
MYKLSVGIHSGGNSVIREKYFEITPGKLEWEIAKEKQELADFPEADKITSDDEAKNFKNQILYIASRDELKQYDKLPLAGKNGFAKAFWKRRDPTPETVINEFKIEHYKRFRYANEAYSSFKEAEDSNKNGWRSDRGRVYIVYGAPSDKENNPSSLEAKPWTQWNYDNVEGGVYFIFIDETGYGNYRLVHSTAQGEPKDYYWENRLMPSSLSK